MIWIVEKCIFSIICSEFFRSQVLVLPKDEPEESFLHPRYKSLRGKDQKEGRQCQDFLSRQTGHNHIDNLFLASIAADSWSNRCM